MTMTWTGYKRLKVHDDDVGRLQAFKGATMMLAGYKSLKMHDDDVDRLEAFKDA